MHVTCGPLQHISPSLLASRFFPVITSITLNVVLGTGWPHDPSRGPFNGFNRANGDNSDIPHHVTELHGIIKRTFQSVCQ